MSSLKPSLCRTWGQFKWRKIYCNACISTGPLQTFDVITQWPLNNNGCQNMNLFLKISHSLQDIQKTLTLIYLGQYVFIRREIHSLIVAALNTILTIPSLVQTQIHTQNSPLSQSWGQNMPFCSHFYPAFFFSPLTVSQKTCGIFICLLFVAVVGWKWMFPAAAYLSLWLAAAPERVGFTVIYIQQKNHWRTTYVNEMVPLNKEKTMEKY